jgi:hypothetical protein
VVVDKRAPRRHRRGGSLSGWTVCGEGLGRQRLEVLGRPEACADPTAGTQRLVWYLVSTTPSGNVRVSIRLRFNRLFQAREGRRAAAHEDRIGDDRVLVD